MKYLTPQPFLVPVSTGRMTDREYFIAVGELRFCEFCKEYVPESHECMTEQSAK